MAIDTKALRDALAKVQAGATEALAAIDAGAEVPVVPPPVVTGPTTPDGRPWPPIKRSDYLTDYDYRAACDKRQAAAGPDKDGYPKVIEVGGTHVLAKAPIDARWKPSMYGHVFGAQPGTAVWDVANGDEAIPYQPLRSPAGFPLRYTLTPDNAVVGTATIVWGEGAYSSDAEVLQMIAATPPPKPPHAMQDTYPNRAALVADAELDAFAVRLDGAPIQTAEAKFGPAQDYVTLPNGSIAKGKPDTAGGSGGSGGTVTPPAGSFKDKAALLAAYPGKAIVLDGALVQEGFGGEDGQPLRFVTAPPFIVPA